MRYANIPAIAVLSLVACSCAVTHTLLPGAEAVKSTKATTDVAGCELLKTVHATPPLWDLQDAVTDMKNETAASGGNAVLVTGPHVGAAYRCRV